MSAASPTEPPVLIRSQRMWVAVGLLVAAGLVLSRFTPGETWFYPQCLFHRVTGLHCPGCGATRAAHFLLHGDWKAALRHNALFVAGLPFLTVFAGRRVRHWIQGRPPGTLAFNPLWIGVTLLAMGVFGVIRNLPFEACRWLCPP